LQLARIVGIAPEITNLGNMRRETIDMSRYRSYPKESYTRVQERPMVWIVTLWLCLFLAALFGFCLQLPSFGYEGSKPEPAQSSDNSRKRISLALPKNAPGAVLSKAQPGMLAGGAVLPAKFDPNLSLYAIFKNTALPLACLNFAGKPFEATVVAASSLSEYLEELDKFPIKNAFAQSAPRLSYDDKFHYMYTPGYGIYKWSSHDEILSLESLARMPLSEPVFH
jgi:hypothetical protein